MTAAYSVSRCHKAADSRKGHADLIPEIELRQLERVIKAEHLKRGAHISADLTVRMGGLRRCDKPDSETLPKLPSHEWPARLRQPS